MTFFAVCLFKHFSFIPRNFLIIFHLFLQTIFWTLITEYTDWSRPSEHPINLLDSTLQILTDALTSAPMMETLEFYRRIQTLQINITLNDNFKQQQQKQSKQLNLNSLFFYVFNNQVCF